MKQFYSFYIPIVILILLSSCQDQIVVNSIDFKNPYRTSQAIEEQIKTDTVPWRYQIGATEYAKKSDYKNAIRLWDSAFKKRAIDYPKKDLDSIKRNYSAVNALEYIETASQKTNIIIINEAHHSSKHRAFTTSLLKTLHDKGYRLLFLEALTNGIEKDKELNERGYATLKTGYYISDPQFAKMIRYAIELGYEILPYETTKDSNGKQREIDQAQNIADKLKEYPNDKAIIHCGFDHVSEGEIPSWEKAMAGRLKDYANSDPLTINQVIFDERSHAGSDNIFLKVLSPTIPSILMDKKSNLPYVYRRGNSYVDLTVLHPRTKYIDNRPEWIFNDDYKLKAIPLPDIAIEFPSMILAYLENEDLDSAIPVDIIELESSSDSFSMVLDSGLHNFVITNDKGQSYLFTYDVH